MFVFAWHSMCHVIPQVVSDLSQVVNLIPDGEVSSLCFCFENYNVLEDAFKFYVCEL